jgi:signal peptidase I
MVSDRREPTLGDTGLDGISITDEPRRKPKIIYQRSPLVAAFLGLLFPPLGFAYVGRPLTVIIFYAIVLGFCGALGWSGLVQSTRGILLVYVVSIGSSIFMAVYCGVVARRTRSTYRKKWFNRWYFYLLFFFAVTIPVVYLALDKEAFLGFATYRIPSGAMEPTIRVGEMIAADTRPTTVANLKPGDVAILVLDPSNDIHFVKRIVAGPGAHVQITPEGLVVDGRLQAREHTQGSDTLQERWMKYSDVTLQNDQFYVLGDNRGNSIDSRTEGPVNRANFRGKATTIFFSHNYDRLGPIL